MKSLTLKALKLDSESQEAYNKAKGLGLNDTDAMLDNGVAYYLSGKYNESIDAYNKAIEIEANPNLLMLSGLLKSLNLRALHRDSEANAIIMDIIAEGFKDILKPSYRSLYDPAPILPLHGVFS